MGMGEPGDGERFAQKTPPKRRIASEFRTNHFESDFAAKGGQLFGTIDLGHASFANALQQFICAQAHALKNSHDRYAFLPPGEEREWFYESVAQDDKQQPAKALPALMVQSYCNTSICCRWGPTM